MAPGDLGTASGAFQTMRRLGGVFGLSIAVAVFTRAGGYGSAAAFGDGFVPALAAAAGFSLAAAVVATGLPARVRQPAPAAAAVGAVG